MTNGVQQKQQKKRKLERQALEDESRQAVIERFSNNNKEILDNLDSLDRNRKCNLAISKSSIINPKKSVIGENLWNQHVKLGLKFIDNNLIDEIESQKIKDNFTFFTLNKNIVGFGASGRGTTFLNYCKIDKKYIKYIIDSSPLRAGKFMPGVKIPIYNMDYLKKNSDKIDYVLIIAWNYKDSIIKQVKKINKKVTYKFYLKEL